jgi:hypothetical protein
MQDQIIELIHTTGEAVGLAGLFFTNILFIRSFMLVSSCIFLISGYFVGLQAMALWSLFYIIINLVQILLILKEKNTSQLTLPQRRLKQQLPYFHISEIKFLCKLSHLEIISIRELPKQPRDCIRFILLGEAFRFKKDSVEEHITQNHFIGQLIVLSNKKPVHYWQNPLPITCICWTEKSIATLKKKKPEIYSKFIEAISLDVCQRLTSE